MNKNYDFELNKLKNKKFIIFLLSLIIQLISLYFFTLVGRFDNSDSDSILKNYITLSGLASTICMCILVVYGTIVINNFIVKNYIGEDKIRFYLYPIGRSKVFYTKIKVFLSVFFKFQFLGIFIANIIFMVTETLFPILLSPNPVLSSFMQFFIMSFSTVLLSISLIFISSVMGIFFNSNVATIIAGVILVVIFGNTLAMAFASNILITLISAITIALVAIVLIKITGINLEKDEVFSK